MRQHAGRLHKAQSLTLEVEGELAARQGGGAATGCGAWIPRTAAGAASTREQANRLYMSPSVGGGRAAPSNRHASGHLLGAVGRCSTQRQHRRRTRACGAAHHSAQKGNHGGAALTTIRTKPPVVFLLHVSRFVCSWSWLWMAAGKFGGFPWDPGETSITPPPQIKAFGLFIVLVVNKILSRDVKG